MVSQSRIWFDLIWKRAVLNMSFTGNHLSGACAAGIIQIASVQITDLPYSPLYVWDTDSTLTIWHDTGPYCSTIISPIVDHLRARWPRPPSSHLNSSGLRHLRSLDAVRIPCSNASTRSDDVCEENRVGLK